VDHRQTVWDYVDQEAQRLAFDKQVSLIVEILGRRTTAYLLGLDDLATLTKWAHATAVAVSDLDRERVRCAFVMVRLITRLYDSVTAESWLFGTNSRFDGRAPAWILHHSDDRAMLRAVVSAAEEFIF